MKILKILGVIVLVALLVLVVLMFVLPTHIAFERSIIVKASPEQTWTYLSTHAARHQWSPWAAMDASMTYTITGEDGTVGSVYEWTGDTTGNGTLTITAVDYMKRIDEAIHFKAPFDSKALDYNTLEEVEEGTKVIWGFSTDVSRPMNVFMAVMGMKSNLISQFDDGLAALKSLVESAPTGPQAVATIDGYAIFMDEWPEKYFMAVRKSISWDEIAGHYEQSYEAVEKVIQEQGLVMNGFPVGIYYAWDEATKTTDLAPGFPVDQLGEAVGEVMPVTLPASRFIYCDYYGKYEESMPAYVAMDSCMAMNGYTSKNIVVEEYLNNSDELPDPSQWITRIYFLIE